LASAVVQNKCDLALCGQIKQDKMADDPHKQSSIKTELSADVASALIGAGVGTLAGPAGTYVGAIAAPLVRHALVRLVYEIQRRQLGPREEHRVATALTVAAEHIQARLDQGAQPRDDGFFEPGPDDRSAAEEIAEAVVRSARDDPQEKKLPYYGRLLANLAFDTTIDSATAHMLIRKADGLTYRQLCLLAIGVRQIDTTQVMLASSPENRIMTIQGLVEEMSILREQGFFQQDGHLIGRQMWNVGEPSPLAENLYRLMSLDSLDAQDVADAAAQVRALRP
jgi:hypothetical protein